MKWWIVPVAAAGVAVVGVAGYGATVVFGDERWPFPWKRFYGASESMAPTIRKGDNVTARRKPASELKRGDIVTFAMGESMWVQRVVGLPGDRVGMRGGQVVLNGQLVSQAAAGVIEIDGERGRSASSNSPVSARRIACSISAPEAATRWKPC